MDSILFREACEKIIDIEREKNGIGTLREKTLHAVLKKYYEPNEEKQEIRIKGYVADIYGEDGIIEIQTRGFNQLRKKLEVFLSLDKVTIVYPVPHTKWLQWINQETGETSVKRKSPKTGSPYLIFPELYRIKEFLKHPNLSLCIPLINVQEYRLLDGWSQDRKKGSSRYDRIPIDLIDEVRIGSIEEYYKLLPLGLEETFSTKEYQKAAKVSLKNAGIALNILFYIGIVEKVGKKGNLILYQINKN